MFSAWEVPLLWYLFPLPLSLQNGFITYSDTLLKAQDREQRRRNGQPDHVLEQPQGLWDSVATYGVGLGAIGVGALLAIGARQAFSWQCACSTIYYTPCEPHDTLQSSHSSHRVWRARNLQKSIQSKITTSFRRNIMAGIRIKFCLSVFLLPKPIIHGSLWYNRQRGCVCAARTLFSTIYSIAQVLFYCPIAALIIPFVNIFICCNIYSNIYTTLMIYAIYIFFFQWLWSSYLLIQFHPLYQGIWKTSEEVYEWEWMGFGEGIWMGERRSVSAFVCTMDGCTGHMIGTLPRRARYPLTMSGGRERMWQNSSLELNSRPLRGSLYFACIRWVMNKPKCYMRQTSWKCSQHGASKQIPYGLYIFWDPAN